MVLLSCRIKNNTIKTDRGLATATRSKCLTSITTYLSVKKKINMDIMPSFKGRNITCYCDRVLYLPHPATIKNKSGKGVVVSHAHCPRCKLEWHMEWNGYVYSHSYHPHLDSKRLQIVGLENGRETEKPNC